MEKKYTLPYEAPEVQVLEIKIESTILQLSDRDGYDVTDENPLA